MFAVSSAFRSIAESQDPRANNVLFTFSGSKESVRILNGSNIRRNADRFTAGNFRINLKNVAVNTPKTGQDGFNILRTDKTHFLRSGNYGITFVDSDGTETNELTLFTGKLIGANYKDSDVNLIFADVFEDLRNLPIGSNEDPVQFLTPQNPADLLWGILINQGLLSSTSPTGNTDIDNASFDQWQSDMNELSITIEANFTGESVADAIQKIAMTSNSVIVGEGDGKLYFYSNKPTLSSSLVSLTNSHIFDITLNMETKDILNKGTLYYNYDPVAKTFAGSHVAQNDSSIATYGTREKIFQDIVVWPANATAARAILDNRIGLLHSPLEQYRVSVGYIGIRHQLGDRISLTDAILSLSTGFNEYGITALDMDIDKGMVKMELEERFDNNWFFLDVASFGLLDYINNPIF